MSCPRLLAPLRTQGLRQQGLYGLSANQLAIPGHIQQHRAHPQRRCLSSSPPAGTPSGLRDILKVSDEVAHAIATDKPVVALESTIYTHGRMGKELAQEHEELVRSHGGIPAIIAIVDGVPKVGVSAQEIVRMMDSRSTVKVSRRDISYLVGMVSPSSPA